MTGAALHTLLSHWRRHPLQLFTLLAGLALATALWSAVQAINAQARASYAQAAAQIGANAMDRLEPADGAMIPLDTYVALRRAGWLVTPVLEGRARLGGEKLTVIGVDPVTHPSLPALDDAAGALSPADLIGPPGRVFARPDTARRIAGLPGMPPVIASDEVPPGAVLTDIAVAERLLGQRGQLSRLLLLPDQPRGLRRLAEIAPELERVAPTARSEIARLTDSFHLNLTAFGLLSFAVGLFIVHGTVGLAFEQRRQMFRTLRALGLPMRRLIAVTLAEIAGAALLAGLAGLALGYLVAAALLPDVAATLRGLYGAPVDGGLSLRPAWVLSGLGMAFVGAFIAGGQALWRLRSLPILAAPGARTWAVGAARNARLQATVGAALILAGWLVLALAGGLIAGFVFLAGLLLGSALLLPAALGLVVGGAERLARGPVTEWVWADMRAQLPGLSLALMALLLALAANIGVGTMVKSFRLTFTGWLDQRLVSELYVTARDDAQGAEIAAWLAPRVDAVLPIRSVERRISGMPVFVYGIIDHPTYRAHWPLLQADPDAWDRVARGEAVLVSEQFARRTGRWTGATVALAPDWRLPVAGVYSDYGNPTGQMILSLPALLAHVGAVPNRRFGIRIAPDRVPGLAEALRRRFDLPEDAIVDQAEIKARSLAIFDKTFFITGALNALTLGVAGFAILTSLLTLWSRRLPQLAPVWALGLTRARLMRLEVARSAALAGLTAVVALPLGLVLAWALLAIINVEAFGWRLPMHLFPIDWLRLAVLALVAASVAAVISARRLVRASPSTLLAVFSNER